MKETLSGAQEGEGTFLEEPQFLQFSAYENGLESFFSWRYLTMIEEEEEEEEEEELKSLSWVVLLLLYPSCVFSSSSGLLLG